jgi:subtilisin
MKPGRKLFRGKGKQSGSLAVVLLIAMSGLCTGSQVSWAAQRSGLAAPELAELKRDAMDKGAVAVIVGLKTQFDPAKRVDRNTEKRHMADIHALQDRVLSDLNSLQPRASNVQRFELLPAIAMKATPQMLDALARSPQVSSISREHKFEPVLAQSVPWIGAPSAWGVGYSGNGRRVAIIDVGVDKTHPFVAGKVVAEACFAGSICPQNGRQGSYPGAAMPYSQFDFHGTYVAGIAAGGDGGSFSGVAPTARLIAINALRAASGEFNEANVLAALDWLAQRSDTGQIAAVNMSFGWPQGPGETRYSSDCDSVSPTFQTAVQTLRNRGIASIAASGNDGDANGMLFPACLSNVISVGGTYDTAPWGDQVVTQWFNKAGGSNSAPTLDLLAPAQYITSSTTYGGQYVTEAGTSASAPHVAGAWAVLKSVKPGMSVSEGLSVLASSGVPVTDPRNGLTRSRIRVNSAVERLFPPCCGNRIVDIGHDGSVWAKEGSIYAPWFLLAGAETGAQDLAASGTRIVNIGKDGSVWAKEGALNAPWALLADASTGAKDVEVSSNRIALIAHDGSVRVKEGSLYAPWSLIAGSEVGAKDVEVTNTRFVFIGWDGSVWGKEGSIYSPGILLADASTGAKDVEVSGNRIALIAHDGSVRVKEGSLYAPWSLIAGSEVGAKDVEVTDTRLVFIGWDGSIWGKEGSIYSQGILLAGAETGAKDVEINGNRILDIGGDGSIWVKEGSMYATWALMAGAETGAKKIALAAP